MVTLEKVLYTAKAYTTGGRDGGSSRTDDSRLQIRLSNPGKPGPGTNPEQLFAVGWSACFLSAIRSVARKSSVVLPSDVVVEAEVDLGLAHGAHHLAARLRAKLPGIDQQIADSLVEAATRICPYSLATKGNIAVTYFAITSEVSDPVGQSQSA